MITVIGSSSTQQAACRVMLNMCVCYLPMSPAVLYYQSSWSSRLGRWCVLATNGETSQWDDWQALYHAFILLGLAALFRWVYYSKSGLVQDMPSSWAEGHARQISRYNSQDGALLLSVPWQRYTLFTEIVISHRLKKTLVNGKPSVYRPSAQEINFRTYLQEI